MHDPTESIRRQRLVEINAEPGSRAALEAQHGRVWDTAELQEQFQVIGFLAPFVVALRRSDNVKGSLEFQHNPRFLFQLPAEVSRFTAAGTVPACWGQSRPSAGEQIRQQRIPNDRYH